MLTIQANSDEKRKKKFPKRFKEKWASHSECRQVIEGAWRQRVGGSPMFCLFQRIRNTRLALIKWEKRAFGDTKVALQQKQWLLEELTRRNDPALMDRIRETKIEINNLLHQEELAWRQRSRAIWLSTGDKNTKFFHQRATQRKRKNQIRGLFNKIGEWCSDEEQIADTAVEYFQDLFTSSQPEDEEIGLVLEVVDQQVTDDINSTLMEPYTGDEVRRALFQMHPSKAPGPDGMSPFFFQKFWSIVRHDVTSAILSALNSGRFLHKMNYTHIALVPQKNDPQSLGDFRPISLGNVISRLFSKVLANRLKQILPRVIPDA